MNSRKILSVLCAAAVLSAVGCGEKISGENAADPPALSRNDSSDASISSDVPESTDESSSEESSEDESDTSNDSSSAPETTTTTSTTTTTTTTTTKATTTTTTTGTTTSTKAATPPVSNTGVNYDTVPASKYHVDSYGQRIYNMTDAYNAFLSDTVFVGDSICSGLKVYKILPADNVCAYGSVAARNIFQNDSNFKALFEVRGTKMPILDALKTLAPKHIVFSMGMNDINLSSPEQWCANYDKLIAEVKKILPNVDMYVASITPIGASTTFNNNANIDKYNAAMKAHLEAKGNAGFVNIAPYLKDRQNNLYSKYSGGDGIHLTTSAYSAILYQVCEQLVDTHKVSGTAKNGVSY